MSRLWLSSNTNLVALLHRISLVMLPVQRLLVLPSFKHNILCVKVMQLSENLRNHMIHCTSLGIWFHVVLLRATGGWDVMPKLRFVFRPPPPVMGVQ